MCTCTDLVIFAPDCTYNRPIVATSHLRFPDSSGSLNDYVSGEEIYISLDSFEVCCQALFSNTGMGRKKSIRGISLMGWCCVSIQGLLPLC